MSTARRTALVFDLDGTLVDSVYQHVLAWHHALLETGIELSIWRIHRRIGMSGGLFMRALLREIGRDLDRRARCSSCSDRHAAGLRRALGRHPAAARGGRAAAHADRARHALGDRHQRPDADGRAPTLERLGVPGGRAGRHPRHGRARQARPRPVPGRGRAAGRRRPPTCSWSATASGTCWPPAARGCWASACSAGGYGTEELERAGAYRVYDDPAMLLRHLDEVGVRGD